MSNPYEDILKDKRGYVAAWPINKVAVMIVSGGLDSIITCARLMEDQGITIYPLHIERGQTNYLAEKQSIQTFSKVFKKRYPRLFKPVSYIKLNVPPTEFKPNLSEYTKKHGHPMRDTVLQIAAVQYAVSLKSQGVTAKTIYCAVMPEDYFPHSNIESIRATNVAVCQNMDDWEWLITSPNIDLNLTDRPISKSDEIIWAHKHNLPIGLTVSCNVATAETNLLNCGDCSSCNRRRAAFVEANTPDITEYYSDGHTKSNT